MSQHIAKIEKELGFQLFRRNNRTVGLPPGGSAFQKEAEKILSLYNQGVQRSAAVASGYEGVLRIGFTNYIECSFLPELIRSFRERFPRIEIVLNKNGQSQTMDDLKTGLNDITLVFPYDTTGYSDIASIPVDSYPICAVLHHSHPLSEREKVSLKELEGKTLIINARDKSPHLYRQVRDDWESLSFAPKSVIETDSADITGYTVEELIGMDGLMLIAEESRDLVMGNILKGYDKPYEAVGLRKSGEDYPLRLAAKNIPYQGRQVRVVEFRDMGDQKRAEGVRKSLEDQLAQSQKLESIGRLAGGVAHDFNNMLGIITGFTELSLNALAEDSPVREYLKEVLDAAERSMEVSGQLLAFARKQTVQPKVVDINETIGNMLKMLKRLIGENITLDWQPGERCPPVRLDPTQMNQILANLSVNSRDAIADVGAITIRTDPVRLGMTRDGVPPGDYVLLSFADSGKGMPEGMGEKIFEPFYTTKEAGKGTGLGLATVYGIARQNGGHIRVESAPGEGAEFLIFLPAAEALPEEKTSASGERAEGQTGKGETVLLVEDEPSMLSMVTVMLGEMNYRVIPVGTPEEALEKAEDSGIPIDLLLTDVIMPCMNGRDLAEKIGVLRPEIKVLYMSGYTSDVIGRNGILEEEIAFIQKPFSRQRLGVTLREILD